MHMFIKLIADGTLVLIIGIAAYGLVFRGKFTTRDTRYDRYTRVVMAGVTTYFFAKVIAALWQPEKLRPFEQLGQQANAAYLNNPGFPSDHTLFAMFLTLAVWYVTRSRWMTSVMLGLTIIMAVGRVLALVHTPLDVVGGIVIACGGSLWYIDALHTKHHKAIVKKAKK